MKYIKKLLALTLAVMLVMSLATTAFAYDITLEGTEEKPTTGHTYSVYQIFTGDLEKDGKTLTNIKYGENFGTEGDAVSDTVLDAITDAAAFAKELLDADGTDDISGTAIATLSEENGWSTAGIDADPETAGVQKLELSAGYYLIVDNGTPAEGDSYSAYIVQVVNDITMAPKSETITSDKVITKDDYSDNYVTDDSVTTDGKYSNGAVGSTVTFELTVNVPANAAGYSYYYCVLNDTLSEGLTFDATSVVVKVGNETLTKDTDYKLYTGDDAEGKTFQIAMLNAKALAGKTITVTYDATINKNAVIGVVGNPNEFDVTYSNNPNHDYDDKNNNGKPNDEENTPTGTTPKKKTRTYVTGVKLIKVDENGNVLTRAEFTIKGESVKYVLTSEETFTEDANGEYWKLANGTYTTEAPRTEDTYVEKTDNRDGGYVKNEDGTYSVATDEQLADETITLYTLLKANASSYASTTTKYSKTIAYTVVGDDATETEISAYVGADGVVYFNGLGEGVYTISETQTPAGYNTISDITLTIDWTAPADASTSTDCTWTATASNVNGTLEVNNEGVFELTIVNNSGSTLPSTGGIGTTIFYTLGGILVLAAVVLLVTKKRMSTAE